MELATTVISLAVAVKELSDTATENVSLCQSLGRRAELIPRLLAKFPDLADIDSKILINLFDVLKQSHDLISQYHKTGAVMRFLRAGSLKNKFSDLEGAIAQCIDELTLCVGISSASKIESISMNFRNQFFDSTATDVEPVETVIAPRDHIIDYTSIAFELKRGVRKEVGQSQLWREYAAILDGRQVCVREPVLPVGRTVSALADQWLVGVNTWAELSHCNVYPGLGGGVEYMDEESSPPERVEQLFVVFEPPGRTLSELVISSADKGLRVQEALLHAHAIMSGLHYLHACSPRIIHGALSPNNIIIDENGQCRITNMLLRYDQLHDRSIATVATDTQWMAPEQAKAPYASTCFTARDVHEAVVTGVRPDIPPTESFLQELIGCCLGTEPASRPSASSVLRALTAACTEKGITLVGMEEGKGDVALVSGDDRRSDSSGDVADFGHLSDHVENMAAAVTVFGRETVAPTTLCDEEGPCVVTYGDKVVLLNWRVGGDKGVVDGACRIDDDEEEGDEGGMVIGHNAAHQKAGQSTLYLGTVIFHIDCTASMKKDNRMGLTKEVLLRVIPSLLQQGLRVWVNSWASNDDTKGRIQTREVTLPDSSLLELEKVDELRAHIQNTVFDILIPAGRTDLYGSCFQLLKQCRELVSQSKPIYAFVLTDGNHNRLDYPLHKPSRPGEDYFGVYKATLLSGTKFGLSHEPFSVEYADGFLSQELDLLHDLCNRANAAMSLTLVGIGDASTKFLSSLTSRLGDKCCFYGITEVNQADAAFGSVSAGPDRNSIVVTVPGIIVIPLTYSVNSGDMVSGCGVIKNQALVEGIHQCIDIQLSSSEKDVELRAIVPSYSHAVQASIEEFVSAIRQVRAECYSVTSESFQSVFKQLLSDKQTIWGIKSSFFSKSTRKLRNYAAFAAIGVWIREVEDMIDAQISSYRMNVESEVLQELAGGADRCMTSSTDDATERKYIIPSDIVLERLQNNLKNAGRPVHKVDRYITAVRNIRDRTLRICAGLLSSQLDLRLTPDGVVLHVATSKGKTRESPWLAPLVSHEIDDRVVDAIRSSLSSCPVNSGGASSGYNSHLMSVVDLNLSEDDTLPLSFPCVLVQARFDPFSIVYAPQMFGVVALFSPCAHGGAEESKSSSWQRAATTPTFCAQEVWDLCRASNHTPASTLPGFHEDAKPNAIVPLAHSPLLFALYAERGRVFHSAINATADCLAMTQMSFQWPKVFLDALLLPRSHPAKQEWVELGLKCVVSFSYAIDSLVVQPSLDAIAEMLNTELVVLPREVEKSGLTCSLAVCSLAAVTKELTITTAHWNRVLLTIFSRLAETIAGHKNVRSPNGRDPGELEGPYRLHLGAIQGAVRKRLHVEWTKATMEEKMDAVRENPEVIYSLLTTVVTEFLSRLSEYHLPLWTDMTVVLRDCLLLSGIGIERLRDMYATCSDVTDIMAALCESLPTESAGFTLPIICSDEAETGVVMREVCPRDVDYLVMYIDALVATKASPKVEYKPVPHPSYPTFTSSQNKQLNVEMARIDWNMKLPVANVTFIGNVNCGKSSLGGRLLEDLRIVDERSVDKLGEQAEKLGYSSNLKHAWLMDNRAAERAGGFTIDPKWNAFQTPTRRFTIIDNPGHKDYVSNTTAGVYHADAVVLVMSAVRSEINLAEMSRSQAEEHLLCAFSLGIKHILVVINKMDLVGFQQVAYEEVLQHTLKKVKKAGFRSDSICFVPVSAVTGDGLLSSSPSMPWYDGPCLLQALDEIQLPKRQTEKKFCMVVHQSFKIGGVGTVVCGKVDRGRISTGDSVSVFPAGPTNVRVRSIEEHHHTVDTAYPGDDVGLSLAGSQKQVFKRGMIITLSTNPPVPTIVRFEAQIFVVRAVNFKVGYNPSILCHLATVPVRVSRIISIIDRNNVVIESNPASVTATQICICEMEALAPFAGETIHESPRLSRFLILESRLIAAMGYVRKFLP